jgi:hypothetical protein
MGGMLFGERLINIEGTMTYEDKKNKIKAVVVFQDNKKADRFVGKIYRYEPGK